MAEEERVGSGMEVDWDDIPDSSLVPDGNFLLHIDAVEAGRSANSGKLMYTGTYRIVEPKEFENLQLKDFFTIGSDDDPTAQEQSTRKRSIGMQRMKNLFKATGITLSGAVDDCCRQAEEQQVMAKVTQRIDNKNTPRNNISRYFPLGEREPGLDDTGADKSPKQLKGSAAKAATAPAAKKKAAPPPGDDDEEGAEEAAPAPAAAKSKVTPITKKPEEAKKPTEAKKPAPAEAKPDLKKCPLCNNMIPRAELKEHMLSCEEDTPAEAEAEE